VSAQRDQPAELLETPQRVATPAAVRHVPVTREPSSGGAPQRTPTRYVSVKPGDTLWRIAQKYRVNVAQLRALNQLTDDRIEIGQALWLPENRSVPGADKDASAP